ncbi:CBS domain-containing protein [Shinella yambaruensis]|uniref:Inosine-5-monophosphate dehydrogenase n=1 Tax=Shinella yambaruensis TaxID=415996 RepID=A0ABQ5ZF57_9HYPH|nr:MULTISPECIES: CBS domain-containing protein [Shinella]CAI0334810.1 putative CBS domain-containing protein YhcV [Rhizobiaceae bacterium]CAK7260236.1 CBS domain-containing protein [Shinella sp. WSC3-e]MCJ8029381.1 CBS domain-containing protein [Shinella yambaruensis]MCO5139528.1 CBS domain-containing protein [Shinella sp.]MCU7984104.1 CBS domain-containing protein [Shinella yambaruensis]
MPIGDIMTRNVHLVRPEETLQYAASLMAEWDIAFLPVADASGLVGTLTDRDIILRAVAPGLNAETTKVGDVMTTNITYCFEDEEPEGVLANMQSLHLRRLAVLDRQNRLAGVVSQSDFKRRRT